jgi:hypothetical protein
MENAFDSHPRMMSVIAAASVIAAGLGTMYALVYLGFPQNLIVIIAPIPAAAVAAAFLYLGRSRSKAAEARRAELADADMVLDYPDGQVAAGIEAVISEPLVASVTSSEASATAPVGGLEDDVPQTQIEQKANGESPQFGTKVIPEAEAPDIRLPRAPITEEISPPQDLLAEAEPESPVIPVESNTHHDGSPVSGEPVLVDNALTGQDVSASSPVNLVMQELEKKIEQQAMVISATNQVVEEAPAAESMEVVDRSKQQITKKVEQRCIVIAAPSHGVLQDRLNNWLSGGYGRVISASMAINGKGFYLTLFYEPLEV